MMAKRLAHLEKLLAHLRSERRKLAEKLANGQRIPSSQLAKLAILQSQFDAIVRAIDDEVEAGDDD
jgi:hypothetical protein